MASNRPKNNIESPSIFWYLLHFTILISHFSYGYTKDWPLLTFCFMLLPHSMNFCITLHAQDWPGLKDLKISVSAMQSIVEQISHFQWKDLLKSLPVFHLWKKCSDLTEDDSSSEALHETLVHLVFHSGPQTILQLSIMMRLNDFYVAQIISVTLHTLSSIWASTKLFMICKTNPPSYGLLHYASIFFIFLAIFAARVWSLALIFSYAKTFITVPIGKATLALVGIKKSLAEATDIVTSF